LGKARAGRVAICRVVFLCAFVVASIAAGLGQDKPGLPDSPQPANLQPSPSPQEKKSEAGTPPEGAAEKTKDLTIEALGWARDWESRWITGVFIRKSEERIPLTAEQRRELYLKQTLTTPGAYMKRMFQAGFDQVRGVPYQWDDGWTGYTERFASREGQFIASNSLTALADAKLKYEPRYDRCRCSGFWPRTWHAAMRNFLTYNESEVELRPQWGLYAGAFAGGLISTAWKPKPRNAFAEGGRAAAEQAGWGVALNFVIEFAGEINRKLGAHPAPTQKFE
jgi:hypothetical protein